MGYCKHIIIIITTIIFWSVNDLHCHVHINHTWPYFCHLSQQKFNCSGEANWTHSFRMSFSNDESGTTILPYNDVDRTKAKNTPSAPPDLLKTYYFGCGPCHPKWLQVFAKKKFFTFLFFSFTCLLASVASG